MEFTREIAEKVFKNIGKTPESICKPDPRRRFDIEVCFRDDCGCTLQVDIWKNGRIDFSTTRKKYRDKVFITDSKVSAEKYAKKAIAHFGGGEVIYTVKPDYYSLIKNGTEYTTDYAVVLAKEIK